MITVFVSAKRRAIIATIAIKRTISVARTITRGKSKNAISVAISVVIEIATVVAIGVAIVNATGITQGELKEVGVKKTRKYLIYAFLCFFVF